MIQKFENLGQLQTSESLSEILNVLSLFKFTGVISDVAAYRSFTLKIGDHKFFVHIFVSIVNCFEFAHIFIL